MCPYYRYYKIIQLKLELIIRKEVLVWKQQTQ